MQALIAELLKEIGIDPSAEGTRDTPRRVDAFYKNFITQGDFPLEKFTLFDAEGTDEMVIQRNISFYSMCEHHLLPFFGTATVAYIPSKKIVGLSKLARVVKWYAARPQNQERMTRQIAEFLTKHLDCLGVGVITKSRHLCMEMRGSRAEGAETICSHLAGVLKNNSAARNEFLNLERK